MLVLDAGNLFFNTETISPGMPMESAKRTGEIIIDAFNKIGCHAFSPGSKDFAAGLDFLQKLQSNANFPFISANIHDIKGNRIFDPYVVLDTDGISIGVIGLASNFNHPEIYVQHPMDALGSIIDELKSQVDIIVLLFNSEQSDINLLHASNYPIDLLIRSKAKIQSGDGGNKKIPVYSCGERGKYIYQFDFTINQANTQFIDLQFHQKQKSRAQEKLNKMKQGNMMADLHSLYQDAPASLKKIDQYEAQITKAEKAITGAINTINVVKHSLDKKIIDRPDILSMVEEAKAERDKQFGPPPSSKPKGNHRHIRHDHDGDGIPDH